MGRGGKRAGSGRKKGAITQRTRDIAEAHARRVDKLMPLEVMLRAMQEHADAHSWDDAAKIAALAAPYCHPKLASVEHSGPNGGPIETKDVSALDRAKALAAVLAASQAG